MRAESLVCSTRRLLNSNNVGPWRRYALYCPLLVQIATGSLVYNNHDDIYSAVIMTEVIARVHL